MRVACVLLGGPNYQLGSWLMELHPYCGPTPVNAKTLEPHDAQKVPQIFFDYFYRWEAGGKKFKEPQPSDKYPVCDVPDWCPVCEGKGEKYKHIGGKHWMYDGVCTHCKGEKVIFWQPQQDI